MLDNKKFNWESSVHADAVVALATTGTEQSQHRIKQCRWPGVLNLRRQTIEGSIQRVNFRVRQTKYVPLMLGSQYSSRSEDCGCHRSQVTYRAVNQEVKDSSIVVTY